LNAIGGVALVLAGPDRSDGSARVRRGRAVLLAASAATLAGLVVLHRVMDARLDEGQLAGFYPLHRLYLWTSTIQWLANVGLLGLATRRSRTEIDPGRPPD
jgi:hypothetical protein